MIGTCGDESFVMLKLFFKEAIFLHLFLFFIGLISAFFVDKIVSIFKIKQPPCCEKEILHKEDIEYVFHFKKIFISLKKISFSRFLLLFILIFFLSTTLFEGLKTSEWDWEKITFVSLLSLSIFIVLTVNEHYLEEHIWEHILKKHIKRVFFWSFFAFFFVDTLLKFFVIEEFINTKLTYVILIASLVGIIPESGPHLIFVSMFYKKLVPFSVLISSSIVQDGHALIPLLSHNVKISIWVKIFNLIIGLIVGYLVYLISKLFI
jgi:hypothetical protein